MMLRNLFCGVVVFVIILFVISVCIVIFVFDVWIMESFV